MTAQYEYDSLGRLTAEIRPGDGDDPSTRYEYREYARLAVPNGGFETGGAWFEHDPSGIQSYSYDSTQAHTGSRSLKIVVADAAPDHWVGNNSTPGWEGGETYWLSAYVKAPAGGLFCLKVAAKTGHEATAGCAAANGEWQAVQGAVTLPADATGFWILLRTQQAGTYYVDDVQVGGLPEAGVYRREDGAGHTLWSRSVYDGLGRLVQEQAEKDGDRAIVVHRSYDALGRLAEESVPVEVSGSATGLGYVAPSGTEAATSYQYDVLGRTVQVTQPDGTTTLTSHGSWTSATSDANAHSRLSRTDAFGRLQSVDENQDAVTFQDDFATLNGDAWVFSGHQVLDGGAIKNSGTGGNWNANFYRSTFAIDGGEGGQGIQVEFKVDGGDTWAHFSLEATGYRLGLVARDNKISVQYNAGAGYVYPANLIDPIATGAWYVVRLKVTPEGSAYVEVWRKDDPGERGIYALQMPPGVDYRFHHWIYSGNAWLDNYREFDALVTTYGYDPLDNLTAVTDTLGITTTMQYDMLGRKIEMDDPDMGRWYYDYDALGNLKWQTDNRGQEITFEYDALNRLVEKHYGDDGSPEARFFYDGDTCTGCPTPAGKVVGQQTAIWTAGSWTVFHYDDARGRLSAEEQWIDGAPGAPFETEYTYDAMDRVVAMTYPDDEVVTTTYNAQGLPVTLTGDAAYISGTSYNALGQVTQLTMGNGTTTSYSYYPAETGNNRLWKIQVGGGSLLDLEYGYDDVGNVSQLIDDHPTIGGSLTFTYDSLDRLTSASGVYSAHYEYSPVGNLEVKNEDGNAYTLQYADPDHVHAVSAVNGFAQAYDANGNMTLRVVDGVTYTQTWDSENRLASVTGSGHTTTFTYGADGALVKKTVDGETTIHVGQHYEKNVASGTVTKYYYLNGQRVAMWKTGDLYYLVVDHLGTTSLVLNVGGTVHSEARHYPYGEERWRSGTLPTDYRFTGQRTVSS
ncbi:MAG: hypothetical protein P8189_28405, partial [Anaerolineae bacterium]